MYPLTQVSFFSGLEVPSSLQLVSGQEGGGATEGEAEQKGLFIRVAF